MVQIRPRILIPALGLTLVFGAAGQRKFYPDDPAAREPKPLPVGKVEKMKIDPLFDFASQSFQPQQRPKVPAQAVNTLGEVPDNAWFTNRHAVRRMTKEELRKGAGDDQRPQPPYELIGAKTDGITPGFRMKDARGRVYFVKPDPVSNPEMATAADVIVSRFFHAIGYETPQNYLVNLRREEVRFSPSATVVGLNGKPRRIGPRDLDKILQNVPYRQDGTVRVVASLGVPGSPIGPFRYEGLRTDDPNDIVLHQNRRDLRGLRVFCAWLNHTDAKAQNSLDAVVERDGTRFIQHYLIDFGSALGSDSDMPKNARFGNEYIIPRGGSALGRMFGLGFVSPRWERARYPKAKALGRIESTVFDPEKWTSNYPNPAFLAALPDDEYWAAKIVMSFRDEEIRSIVETGEFTDTAVTETLTKILAERRDKIGRTYFSKVLALDNFSVVNGELKFEDLVEKYGFGRSGRLEVTWSRFDNEKGAHSPVASQTGFRLPAEALSGDPGRYYAARIEDASRPGKTLTVYLRTRMDGADVAGIERTW